LYYAALNPSLFTPFKNREDVEMVNNGVSDLAVSGIFGITTY
jgi:nitrogen regulatory protein PII-like uncharacterized protein